MLRELAISSPIQDLPPVEVFFGPQLRVLSLEFHGSTAIKSITYLPTFSPNIQTLHLTITQGLTVRSLAPVIAQLNTLCDLCLLFSLRARPEGPSLSSEICEALSRLPCLERFKTNWLANIANIPRRGTQNEPTFTKLRSLVLLDCLHPHVPPYLSIIRKYKFPNLRTISVNFAPRSTEVAGRDTIKDLMQAMKDSLPRARLTRCFLTCPSSGVSKVTPASLEPLLLYHKLETIRLRNCVELDDADYERMARAWPQLRNAELTTSGLWEVSPSPANILHFVRHCPRLNALTIEFDATRIGELHANGRPGGGATNDKIKRLVVGRSRITFENRFTVAAFLADVFPNLEEISVSALALEKNTWEEVQAIFRGLLVPMRKWQNTTVLVEADTSRDADTTL